MRTKLTAIIGVAGASLCAAALLIGAATASATPYASCVVNNSGTIQFYLNESGGNVTVTYEDGSTNASFNGITTGTNLPSGVQSFSLAGHTAYSISVFKVGTGNASVIQTIPYGTPRGIDVNKNPSSPYFGNVYTVNAANAQTNQVLWRLNSDLSGIATNGGGIAWINSSSDPYRIAVNDDDYLTVGSFASAHSGVWRIDPTLSTGQLLLGPIGQTAGYAAGSQGDQFSRPLLIGNLQSGGTATLLTVDAGSIPGINNGQLNSILVYSNLTLANLPRTNPPDLLGPEVCLDLVLNNNYPGITYNKNGYIYVSNRRDGPSGGSATVQIYAFSNLVANTVGGPTNANGPGVSLNDPTSVGCVWDSYYNGGVNDYFDAPNGSPTAASTTGPCDSAVSADAKYFAALGYGDCHIIVCSLTNGIPDVSTLYTIYQNPNPGSAGRGLCWDAADNIYVSSSALGLFQEWTLGFTATAVTTGNASGATGFSLVLPSSQVGVSATNSIGTATVSQANPYGNPTSATFTITRTGNTSGKLTVPFTFGGTAASGTYTSTATGSVILQPGQSSTNITITAVNDSIARPTTTIILTLATSPSYALAPASATLYLINTAPDQLVASPLAATMYNAFSNDYASFTITRWGDTNADSFTVSTYTYAGTAVAGVDYTLPGSVTFNPGDIVYTNYISPLSNGQLPVDSSSNPYVGNKTAIISIPSGSGYSGSTNAALLYILDSANPTTTVLFSDPLTDAADQSNWNVTSANNNMQTNSIDDTIIFGYDLQNGDPSDYGAVPLPPNGASTALRVTVNKSSAQGSGAAAGVNLYPKNVSFSGNYAVRFNMNIIQGLSSTYSTEGPLIGINHSGKYTNWWSASGLLSGWGSTPPGSESWSSDGVWYWINADNDYSGGAYIEFTGVGGTNNNSGWQQPAIAYPPTYANAFNTNIFTGGVYWGPGLISNGSILNGYSANNWADVEIKQINDVVTMSIDKTPVFVYTNKTVWTSGTLMLGYNDPFSSVGSLDGAVYFSNVRVVAVGAPVISQIAIDKANSTAVINFTVVDGDSIASSFALQSASSVEGPYTDVPGANITQLSAGAFQAVVAQSGSAQYYRIREIQ